MDTLKLRKRVPVLIKLHESLVTALNQVLPSQILKLDRNAAMLLLPVIILGLAQIPSMIWQAFLEMLGLAPAKTVWSKSRDGGEFSTKFSFDQVDQYSQLNAVS